MKKRTMMIGAILGASIAHAGPKADQYLKENTGANQRSANELCLKVQTYSVGMIGPSAHYEPSPVGLIVASGSAVDLVKSPNMDSGACDDGYIKITTTAPLMSLEHAPVGL
jgi:hypothetical protein